MKLSPMPARCICDRESFTAQGSIRLWMKQCLALLAICSFISLTASAQEPQEEKVPPRELAVALDRAVNENEHLGTALRPVPDRIIRDQANADKLLQLINRWDLATALARPEGTSQLSISIGLMTNAIGEEVIAKLRTDSKPKMLSFADAMIESPVADNNRDLVFLLQWLALTGGDEGTERVIRAAKAGIGTDEPLWPIVFDPYSTDSPNSRKVLESLGNPIPPGMIGLGVLECANGLSLGGVEIKHPYDSDEGVAKLQEWLSKTDEASSSTAQSAAAALPFLMHVKRNDLLQLAVNHPHPLVKAEAGWALVMLEDQRGFRLLQTVCKDVRYSITAQIYLEELDAADQIPAEVKENDFAARAEFCHFLSLPDQLGDPPTEIEMVGSQVLYWPPTKDRRRMSVVKFKYLDSEGKVVREGVGVVGSLTAWLPDLTNVEMSGGDVLAIQCCYELRYNRDPQAPEKIDAATGLDIIRRAQAANPAPRPTGGAGR